jgi:heat shock protein HslJ
MLQEGTFLAALGETKGYAVEGNRLTLTGAGGGNLLSFTADA